MRGEFFDKLLAFRNSQSLMHDAEDMASVERQLINLGKEALMRQGKRLKLNGRGSGLRASEILGILEGTCRVVLFQISAVDGIP